MAWRRNGQRLHVNWLFASAMSIAKIHLFEAGEVCDDDHQGQPEALRVKAFILVAAAAAGACLIAGCGAPPMHFALSDSSRKALNEQDQEKLLDTLEAFFGTPKAPKADASLKNLIKADETQLAEGAASYRRLCMHCHGLSGDGNGPTANFLLPLPRDYRKGIFKFTSIDIARYATRDDLRTTLNNGIAGTSMPSFALFDSQEIENVLDFVILLALRGRTESLVVEDVEAGLAEIDAEAVASTAAREASNWAAVESRIVKPKTPRTEPDAESIERGRQLYLSDRAQCRKCHGDKGLGDGLLNDPTADPKDTTDSWGHQAHPANLTFAVYRGGGRPLDLFRRIHSGIKGTPMPAQSTNLKDEEIWDLVNFVRHLPYAENGTAPPVASDRRSGG